MLWYVMLSHVCMNVWMHKCMNVWMYEYMYECINEMKRTEMKWMNEWLNWIDLNCIALYWIELN